MLRQMQMNQPCMATESINVPYQEKSKYSRCEKDDLKVAIDALYEFRKKLDELHPSVIDIIEKLLQKEHYR